MIAIFLGLLRGGGVIEGVGEGVVWGVGASARTQKWIADDRGTGWEVVKGVDVGVAGGISSRMWPEGVAEGVAEGVVFVFCL